MIRRSQYYGVRPRYDWWGLVVTLASVLIVWGGAVVAIAWRILTEGGLP